MKIRVYYDDTDAGGIVYHANYIKYCERARSELFFQYGKSPAIDGGHFVVKHLEADFIKSAKLGDILEVRHEILEMKNASIKLLQNIFKEDEKIFEIISSLVFVKNGRPSRIDKETKEFILKILG